MKVKVRARHETVNGKLTCFNALKVVWRHPPHSVETFLVVSPLQYRPVADFV